MDRLVGVGSGVRVSTGGQQRSGYLDLTPEALEALISRDPITTHYQVEHTPFARGKFAAVRRARCLQSGTMFAAKVMRKRRRAQDVRHEILHEAAVLLLARPSHRIVSLHQLYETPSEIILLLELAEGGELQRVIDEEESLPEEVVRRYMTNILEALRFLHAHKIAHLDLKPQNLLLTDQYPDSEVKLCDFGISRIILADIEVREVLGTPDYVAPEILQYEPISLSTDMWSVGVLVYVLLTGHSPFGGDTKQETFMNISQGQVDFPEELFDDVSGQAINFITQLLLVDPLGRMTVDEALEHPWLSGVGSDQPLSASPVPSVNSTKNSLESAPNSPDLDQHSSTSNVSPCKSNGHISHISNPECNFRTLASPTHSPTICEEMLSPTTTPTKCRKDMSPHNSSVTSPECSIQVITSPTSASVTRHRSALSRASDRASPECTIQVVPSPTSTSIRKHQVTRRYASQECTMEAVSSPTSLNRRSTLPYASQECRVKAVASPMSTDHQYALPYTSQEPSMRAFTPPTQYRRREKIAYGNWGNITARQVREQDLHTPSTSSSMQNNREADTSRDTRREEETSKGTRKEADLSRDITRETEARRDAIRETDARRDTNSTPWKPSHALNKENNKNTINKHEEAFLACKDLVSSHESPSKTKSRLFEKSKREADRVKRDVEPVKKTNSNSKEGKENKEIGKDSVKEKQLKPSPLCLRRQGSKCDLKSPTEQQKYGAGTVSIILEKSIIC